MGLTHFDENGKAFMVDVTEKGETIREATASGKIVVNREVYEAICAGTVGKGEDVYKRQTEFNDMNNKLYESAWKSQFISGMMMPIMQFVGNLGYVAVAILGGYLVIKDAIEVGDIQSFIQYVRNFTQPIQQLSLIHIYI